MSPRRRCRAEIATAERLPTAAHLRNLLDSIGACAGGAAAAVLLLLGSAVAALAQDSAAPTIAARAGVAIHAAGLERSRLDGTGGGGARWRHRVEPAPSFGISVALPLRSGPWGVRIDGELVPRADIRGDPMGPPLLYPTSGKSYWFTASATLAPVVLCYQRCVRISGGFGRGFYDYAAAEIRGDIGNLLARPQHTTVGRIGVDVRLPIFRRIFQVELSDHFGRLTPSYSETERLSPIHTLVISGGLVLGR